MQSKTTHPSNMDSSIKRIVSAVSAFVLSACVVLALAGCSAQEAVPGEGEQELTASNYMVKLNQASVALRDGLQEFSQAVADDDVATLQSKASLAYESMDAIDDLKAPEELKDISQKYKEAISSLRTSLDEYIQLYVDVQGTPEDKQVDSAKYSEKLEKIQKSYDSGMNLLDEADSEAAKL